MNKLKAFIREVDIDLVILGFSYISLLLALVLLVRHAVISLLSAPDTLLQVAAIVALVIIGYAGAKFAHRNDHMY